MSTDHGVTWSTPEEISGNNPAICTRGNRLDPSRSANDCANDQGSDPVVLPSGDLVVPFRNLDAPLPNSAQELAVHCAPSGSSSAGTAHFNCAAPVRIDFDHRAGEPLCNFGRGPEECIPGAFIRTNDFPRSAVDKSNSNLFVTWQDYRNAEFDIVLARSNDGGATWTVGSLPVNATEGKDEYMPAIDVGTDHKVAVSFYQTDRVPNENTTPAGGFAPGQPGVQASPSSYWLSGRQQTTTGVLTPFTQLKISPDFAPPDGGQAGFNGDYSGLAVIGNTAHPVWSDTRNPAVLTSPNQGVVHDEDIFTDALPIP
jgi:hypothetical protein